MYDDFRTFGENTNDNVKVVINNIEYSKEGTDDAPTIYIKFNGEGLSEPLWLTIELKDSRVNFLNRESNIDLDVYNQMIIDDPELPVLLYHIFECYRKEGEHDIALGILFVVQYLRDVHWFNIPLEFDNDEELAKITAMLGNYPEEQSCEQQYRISSINLVPFVDDSLLLNITDMSNVNHSIYYCNSTRTVNLNIGNDGEASTYYTNAMYESDDILSSLNGYLQAIGMLLRDNSLDITHLNLIASQLLEYVINTLQLVYDESCIFKLVNSPKLTLSEPIAESIINLLSLKGYFTDTNIDYINQYLLKIQTYLVDAIEQYTQGDDTQ